MAFNYALINNLYFGYRYHVLGELQYIITNVVVGVA